MSRSRAYAEQEKHVIATVDADLDHVPDAETEAYDARLVADAVPSEDLLVVGKVVVPCTTPVEIKTCQRWIRDRGSNSGRRRGRWKIDRRQVDLLKRNCGVFLLVVLDDETVLRSALVTARELEPLVEDRYTTGAGNHDDKRAILPWPEVFDPTTLEGSA